MSVKPRTIDNLGIDSSIRYAKDKELLDTRLVEESRFIPKKTEVSMVRPYVPSEFEEFFAPAKLILWASFAPPTDYYTYSKPIFSYQLIPSLGGYEKLEAGSDKLEGLEDALNKPNKRKQSKEQSHDQQQEEEKERLTLVALFKCINKLDRTLTLINSRRNQYQRG